MKINEKFGGLPHFGIPPQLLRIMKLTTIIMTVFLMQVSALTKAQITLNEKGTSLQKVLEQISTQSGYDLVYSSLDFKNARPVTIKLNDVNLNKALEAAFEGQPLMYEVTDKTVMIRKKAEKSYLENVIARFLAIDVRGKILNENGDPLSGATISVKGKNQSTKSNSEGSFYLPNVDENATLQISFIGYITREIAATNDLGDIRLELGKNDLQEVVINKGYYKETKLTSTGNVGSVSEADIERQNINNPTLALQGRVAGVTVVQATGIPGTAVNISIRGNNSLTQGSEPLFVVDGVPYTNSLFNTPFYGGLGAIFGGTGQTLGLNPLSLINPNDIESIDVLKDADATAIYGSRGSNGVILITTKKGKAGPTKVDLNMQTGFGNISRRVKLLNTQQYLEMRKEAFTNDDVVPSDVNGRDLLSYDQNAYTDWQDVMIGGTSKYTNAQTSVSGGNTNTQYLLGGNYHRETTVFPGKWADEKVSVHFNINNQSPNQKFKISFLGNYLSDNNQPPFTDYTQYITLAPNAPSLYKPDGTLNWTTYSNNAFKDLQAWYTAKTSNLIANSILSYQLLPGLEIKSSFGFNNILLNEKRATPMSATNPSNVTRTGRTSFNTNEITSWIVEPQINYLRNIGRGKLSVLIGGTIQNRKIEGQGIDADGYTDDGLLGTMAGAKNIYKGITVFEQYRYSSLLARINYNYQNRYLVNLTGRRDGSSRFGPGSQYGNFGAVGIGWLFSNEKFVKDNFPILSYGKLRASYGTSGNEPSSNYAFLELYNLSTDLPYGGGRGIVPNNLPNAVYQWEVNHKAEIGFEFGLFDDRIVSTTSFYRNRSSNQLVSRPLASSVGFSGIIANFPATIQNKGWEFTLSSVNLKNKDFSWNTGFNLTFSRNKLLKIDKSQFFGAYRVGEPLDVVDVYHSAGVDPESGFYQFYDQAGKTTLQPSEEDRNHLISVNPKYFGGLQNILSYKNFSLEFNLQFVKQQGKNYLFSNSLPPGWFQRSNGLGNQPEDVLDRTIPGQRTGNYQKFTQTFDGITSYQYAVSSDRIYSDASFIRMKNASLSYLLPSTLTKKFRLQTFRLYVQGQNLFTITNYKGADPETQNFLVLPTLRVITAGVQLTL